MSAAVMLASACAFAEGGRAQVATPLAREPVECAAYATLPESLVSPGAILLFGEVHGVQEFPAFFAEAVCRAASTGEHVIAALELPGSEQARVDRFFAADDEPSALQALTASAFWTREYQDGRSSQAMAALLARLRRLRVAGLHVDAFLFDVETPGPDRDARMAAQLAGYVRSHPDGRVLALTGNLHARTAAGAPWDPQWRPMGWFLRQTGVRVASLDVAGPRGTAWICQSDSASSCGVRDVRPGKVGQRSGTGLEVSPEPSPEGFAGLYFTATVTASGPAVPSAPRSVR